MKKIWFPILLLVVLGNAFLLPKETTAQQVFLSVDKDAVEVGEIVSGEATIILYEKFMGNFYIYFGDGTSGLQIDCQFNPDAPSGITQCDYKFIHVYDMPNIYQLTIETVYFTGIGVIHEDTIGYKKITIAERATSSIATAVQPALAATSTAEIIQSIVRAIYWIVSSLLVLLIMIGGFTIITAAGDPKRVTKGKQIIVYAIIGFAIMAVSRGILELIYLILGVNIP